MINVLQVIPSSASKILDAKEMQDIGRLAVFVSMLLVFEGLIRGFAYKAC